jgi:hypothetical protein
VPWTFLPLPARVRRRAAIRDPFPLSRRKRVLIEGCRRAVRAVTACPGTARLSQTQSVVTVRSVLFRTVGLQPVCSDELGALPAAVGALPVECDRPQAGEPAASVANL